MPTHYSLRKLLVQHFGKRPSNSVSVVAHRFLQVFQDHGIGAPQIPRLLQVIRLEDLQTPETLLSVLTPEVLDQVAELFNTRREWLEGVDDDVYEYLGCYGHPLELLGHLSTLVQRSEANRRNFFLRVLTTTKHLDSAQSGLQMLVPVLVEPITTLGDKEICRYYVYSDGFEWNYEPARIQLKAMARIVFKKLGKPVPLYVISKREMDSVLEGKVVPRRLLRGGLLTDPSLEDYALAEGESARAKEVDELPTVLSYIEEHHLDDYPFQMPAGATPFADMGTAVEPIPNGFESSPGHRTGKRVRADTEIWDPARHVAKAIWAEEGPLRIEQVARRIKANPSLKASAYSVETIHRRIAEAAPPEVRGKPGRTSRKSS